MKFSDDVKKTIRQVTLTTIGLGLIMIGVFALFNRFSMSVVTGALIGCGVASLNFFLLSVTLHKAVDSDGRGKSIIAMSYTARNVMILVVSMISITILKVNVIALLLPLIFPKIAIQVLRNRNSGRGSDTDEH